MRQVTVIAVVLLLVGMPAAAAVTPELLTIKAAGDDSPVCATAGAVRTVDVLWSFDVTSPDDAYEVQGWSQGVLLENSGGATSYIQNATEHPDLQVAGPGEGQPSFDTINYYAAGDLTVPAASAAVGSTPDAVDGAEGEYIAVTQGVVLDFMQKVKLPAPKLDFGTLKLEVVLQGDGAGTTTIGFSNEVGKPATKTVVVVGGQSYEPGQQIPLVIDILGPDDPNCQSDFFYLADDSSAEENILKPRSDEGVASVVRTILLHEVPKQEGNPATGVQALSLSMTVPAGLAVEGALGEDAATAEFFEFLAGEGCFSAGIVMEFEEPYDMSHVLQALEPAAVLDLTVSTIPESWLGVEDPAELQFALDSCSTPPVAAVVVVNGESKPIANPDFVMIQRIEPITRIPFVRGDANADGLINIADGIYTINWLFRGGPEPPCKDAADVDDNNAHEVTDVIMLISYLFNVTIERGGDTYAPQPPAAPFPECGLDETGGTAESCASYPPCAE